MPVEVDVTPRRLQRFRLAPGQAVLATVGHGAPRRLTVDADGLITVPRVRIVAPEGTVVRLTRAGGAASGGK